MPVQFELDPFEPCQEVTHLGGALAYGLRRHACNYTLSGDLDRIRWPERVSNPGRHGRLWEDTCFEMFLTHAADQSYTELNFAPNGNWNAYHFSGYRQGMKESDSIDNVTIESILTSKDTRRLEITFSGHHSRSVDNPVCVGVAAIVKNTQGHAAYFALNHPTTRPDFHRRENFSLELTE